jgi:hypothetical protein
LLNKAIKRIQRDAVPDDIDRLLDALAFDKDAIWPWPRFVERISSDVLSPLRPASASRVRLTAED